ncbi:MAG TPA: hypothetical protein EYN69_09400 [Flavobacteriales bacterium]|nr:hypothetical protein [Flavobacteriales bacterium]
MVASRRFILLMTLFLVFESCGDPKASRDFLPRIYLFGMDSVSFEGKSECYLSYLDEDEDDLRIDKQRIMAKYRGGMSAGFPKHSMTIKLRKAHALAGLKNDRDWILNASYIDKSFMRHKLAFDLFNSFSTDNEAPATAYVEVYMDSNYYGLYVLMERMDASALAVDKQDSTSFIFKGPPIFLRPALLLDSLNLIPFDNQYQKSPRIAERNMHSHLTRARDFIARSSNEEFSSEPGGIQDLFDIKNIIDWHLLLLVTNSEDGLAKNYYVYKKNEGTGIRIAPWDYDHTFGRDGDNEPSWESFIDCHGNFMLKRLLALNPNNYRESLKRRYIELKERGILTSEYINGMIQENYRIIEPCLDRNAAAWPMDAALYYDSLNTTRELELIKKWTVKHMRLVDELMLAN